MRLTPIHPRRYANVPLTVIGLAALSLTSIAGQPASGSQQRTQQPSEIPSLLPEGVARVFGSLKFRGQFSCATFTPDGQHIVASTHQAIQFWNLESGEVEFELRGTFAEFSAVAILPDGRKLAAGGDDGQLAVWDIPQRREIVTRQDGIYRREINDVAFFPDGSRFVVCRRDRTVQTFDAATGRSIQESLLSGESDDASETLIAVSPSGGTFTVSSFAKVHIFDAESHRELRVIDAHSANAFDDEIASIAYLSDKELLSSGAEEKQAKPGEERAYEQVIKVWNVKTGELLRELPRIVSNSSASDCHVAPDRTTVISRDYETLHLIDPKTGELRQRIPLGELGYYANRDNRVAISPDGKLMVLARLRLLQRYDLEAGKQIAVPGDGHVGAAIEGALSPDGSLRVTIGGARGVKIWDTSSGEMLQTISVGDLRPDECLWSADGSIVYLFGSRSIPGGRLHKSGGTYYADGAVMAFDINRRIKLFETACKCPQSLSKPAISLDGKRLAIAVNVPLLPTYPKDLELLILDARNGEILQAIERSERTEMCAFSADGSRLVTIDYRIVPDKLNEWEVATGEHIRGRELSADAWKEALSSDGSLFAVGTQSPVRVSIRNVETLQERHALEIPGERLDSLVFSGRQDWIITMSQPVEIVGDRSYSIPGAPYRFRVWDSATGELLSQLPDHACWLSATELSPDGQMFYADTPYGVGVAYELKDFPAKNGGDEVR